MPRAKKTAKLVYYGTGRRKTAVAKVRVITGQGKIVVNDKPVGDYFGRRMLEVIIRQPLETVAVGDKYDVVATVMGGGVSGQAGAVRHGLFSRLFRQQQGAANGA